MEAPPGHIRGHAPVEAWFVDEDTLRDSIQKKCTKAKARLERPGADIYLVGLAIDDASLSRGGDVRSLGNRSFRRVPASRQSRFDEALQRGRAGLLEMASFDRTECGIGGSEGLYFDPMSEHVGGVLAIYYTEQLQFVPNPFTSSDTERLCRRFPPQLSPFPVG